jgi:hypothetical protein
VNLLGLDENLDPSPFYVHLGHARTLAELRTYFERQSDLRGKAIRIEKARYRRKEGRTQQGCPIAKYVSVFSCFFLMK